MALTKMAEAERAGLESINKVKKMPTGDFQTILYVEDDDTNWEITEIALSQKFKLVRASNDEQAFKRIQENAFAVILMDIQLAGSDLNGIQITKHLKNIDCEALSDENGELDLKDTPIIFVTSYGGHYTKQELVAAGGDDLVTKPVDFKRLGSAIARLIARNLGGAEEKGDGPEHHVMRATARKNMNTLCAMSIDGAIIHGETIDVSAGGFKAIFHDPRALEVLGIGAQAEVGLPGIFGGLKCSCTVRRISKEEPYTIGVQLMDLNEDLSAILHRWIYGE